MLAASLLRGAAAAGGQRSVAAEVCRETFRLLSSACFPSHGKLIPIHSLKIPCFQGRAEVSIPLCAVLAELPQRCGCPPACLLCTHGRQPSADVWLRASAIPRHSFPGFWRFPRIYMSLKENLFPPWSRNCVSQLSVKVYTDAHQHNGCAPFTWKQKSLEFLVILLLNKTFCLWGFLYFR